MGWFLMEREKLTRDEWDALLDDEKIPVQPQQRKEERCLDEIVRDAVHGMTGYNCYLAGMAIRCIWHATDLELASWFLDELRKEMGK
jgi:hypothetical protein